MEIITTAITEYFRKSDFAEKFHYNQSVMLKSVRRLNRFALRMAVRQLCCYHDMLRSIWNGTGLEIRDKNCDGLFCFKELDFTSMDKTDSVLQQLEQTAAEMQTSIDISNGPLVNVAHFVLRESDMVYIVIHHLAVDGVSWRIILEDLNDIYSQLAAGATRLSLPKIRCTYPQYAESVHKYAKTAHAYAELPYWSAVAHRVRTVHAGMPACRGNMASVDFRLEMSLTDKLVSCCPARYGVGINDILVSALAAAWHSVSGQDFLSLTMEGHGRESFGPYNLPLDRVVGWFTTLYPVVVNAGSDSVTELLEQTAATMRQIPNNGFGYGTLLHISGQDELACIPTITFNYLGVLQESFSKDCILKMSDMRLKCPDISPKNRDHEPLEMNCWVSNECLSGFLEYDECVLDGASAKRLLDSFKVNLAVLSN